MHRLYREAVTDNNPDSQTKKPEMIPPRAWNSTLDLNAWVEARQGFVTEMQTILHAALRDEN